MVTSPKRASASISTRPSATTPRSSKPRCKTSMNAQRRCAPRRDWLAAPTLPTATNGHRKMRSKRWRMSWLKCHSQRRRRYQKTSRWPLFRKPRMSRRQELARPPIAPEEGDACCVCDVQHRSPCSSCSLCPLFLPEFSSQGKLRYILEARSAHNRKALQYSQG